MDILIERVLILLTTPPGNFAYFLVLLLSVIGALQGVWEQRRDPVEQSDKSAIIGFLILLTTVLIPLVFQIFAWMGSSIGENVYHLIEDTCISIGIVWIIRLCIPFNHQKIGDIPAIILTIFFFFLFVAVGLINQQTLSMQEIQHSLYDKTWHILTLSIIPPALFILWIKHKERSICRTAILLLALTGQIIYLFTFYDNADPIGTIHFFQFLSFPLLLCIPQIQSSSRHSEESSITQDDFGSNQLHYSEEFKDEVYLEIIQPLIRKLDSEEDGFKRELVSSFIRIMEADIGYLILSINEELLRFESGCNLLEKLESLPDINVDKPLGRKILLYLIDKSAILEGLDHKDIRDGIGDMLLLDDPGNIMITPIPNNDPADNSMGIMLLNPYSQKNWTPSDQDRSELICKAIGPLLHYHQQQEVLLQDLANTKEQEIKSLEAIDDFQSSHSWFGHVDLRKMPLLDKVRYILLELEKIRILLDQNKQREKNNISRKGSTELSIYEQRFRLLLEEIARLKQELAEAEKNKFASVKNISQDIAITHGGVILGNFPAEIMETMTTTIRNVEILLSESIGIIGEKQRGYLQKILASLKLIHESLGIMEKPDADNLDKVELIEIDIEHVIDQAIKQAGNILHRKRITLQLDIPSPPPSIGIAQDLFQKIVNLILLIACKSSTRNGFIRFHLQRIHMDSEDFILLEMDKVGGDPFPTIYDPKSEKTEPSQFDQRPRQESVQDLYLMIKSILRDVSGRSRIENPDSGGFTLKVLLPCRMG